MFDSQQQSGSGVPATQNLLSNGGQLLNREEFQQRSAVELSGRSNIITGGDYAARPGGYASNLTKYPGEDKNMPLHSNAHLNIQERALRRGAGNILQQQHQRKSPTVADIYGMERFIKHDPSLVQMRHYASIHGGDGAAGVPLLNGAAGGMMKS